MSESDKNDTSIVRVEGAEFDSGYPLAANTQEEAAEDNPVKGFFDLMYGRWVWVIVLACVIAPVLAVTGYIFGSVKYSATAVLVVEEKLEALVRDTPETAAIAVANEVAEQSQLLKNPQVVFKAANDPVMENYRISRPRFARDLVSNLDVRVPPRSSVILVSMSDEDSQFAADAVNSIVRAYLEVFVPSKEIAYQEKVARLEAMISSARLRIAALKRSRVDLLSNSQYATIDAGVISEENVRKIRDAEGEVERIQKLLDAILASHTLEIQMRTAANGEDITAIDVGEPSLDASVPPSPAELEAENPGIRKSRIDMENQRIDFELIAQRFGAEHEQYRRAKASLDALKRNHEARLATARAEYNEQFGDLMTWGALKLRRETLLEEMSRYRSINGQLELDRIKAEEVSLRIENEEEQLQILVERNLGLEREKDSIRQGRVSFSAPAVATSVPTSNKKMSTAIGGLLLGVVLAIGSVLGLALADQKVYGVRQLKGQRNKLRVLGVMPDMNESESSGDSLNLARDCIHRIRGRIESRRKDLGGYALMVSSPFQGDGKTTFTVSLGWSYAESGYRTLLIDTDFIGRAMTHQFGVLRKPGLKEVIRAGKITDEIMDLGHPNLNLLGIGFDRRVSAANLSPRIMISILEQARASYDIVIIDSGPITASIESMSVASASDGGVLCLRKGRSRDRVKEGISDFAMVGTDYLGVVLNYASRSDCERYGSTSRISESAEAALGRPDNLDPEESERHIIADLDAES